jgi:IclR family mhp operon transcriptional activator
MAVKQIKSLHKAIDVLEILDQLKACTLAELHGHTGIPKATLLRAIRTLEARNFVRRSLADDKYRANIALPHARTPATAGKVDESALASLAQAATPELEILAQYLPWPSDVFVRSGLAMELLETSRAQSPLLVNRNQIGDQVQITVSAVGRTYLAYCSEKEREDILTGLEGAPERYLPLRVDRRRLKSDLGAIRRQGYGLRDPRFAGATVADETLADQLSAIAVPIRMGNRVAGCINMLWPKSAYSAAEFVQRHLDGLATAAVRIASALKPVHGRL